MSLRCELIKETLLKLPLYSNLNAGCNNEFILLKCVSFKAIFSVFYWETKPFYLSRSIQPPLKTSSMETEEDRINAENIYDHFHNFSTARSTGDDGP